MCCVVLLYQIIHVTPRNLAVVLRKVKSRLNNQIPHSCPCKETASKKLMLCVCMCVCYAPRLSIKNINVSYQIPHNNNKQSCFLSILDLSRFQTILLYIHQPSFNYYPLFLSFKKTYKQNSSYNELKVKKKKSRLKSC